MDLDGANRPCRPRGWLDRTVEEARQRTSRQRDGVSLNLNASSLTTDAALFRDVAIIPTLDEDSHRSSRIGGLDAHSELLHRKRAVVRNRYYPTGSVE
jgi:hypothetical protein